MAKFTGIPPITGTIGPVCIYKMHGKYFMRTASSLTGKRVKKDPAFRKTMQYAGLLAKASRTASAVYRTLPADQKQHSLYRKLTGEAMTWLKEEWTVEEVLAYLLKMYTVQPVQANEAETVVVKAPAHHSSSRLAASQLYFVASGNIAKGNIIGLRGCKPRRAKLLRATYNNAPQKQPPVHQPRDVLLQ